MLGTDPNKKIKLQLLSYETFLVTAHLEYRTEDFTQMVKSLGGEFDMELKGYVVPWEKYKQTVESIKGYLKLKNQFTKMALEEIPTIVLDYVTDMKAEFLFKCKNFEGESKSFKIEYKSEIEARRGIHDIHPDFSKKLYKFQKDGINFGISRFGRVLIADEMGVGKTIQALALAAVYVQEWPVLVICPSSLKYNWRSEVTEWLSNYIRADYVQVLGKSSDSFKPGCRFFVISYDLAKRMAEKLARMAFKVAIVDEAHYLKNPVSKRSEMLTPVLKTCKRVIMLTGTPALAKPRELYPVLSCIRPDVYTEFMKFGKRYCNPSMNRFTKMFDYDGADNMEELNFILKGVMIRRLKKDVLSELPSKIRQKVEIRTGGDKLKEIQRLMNRLESTAGNQLGGILEKLSNSYNEQTGSWNHNQLGLSKGQNPEELGAEQQIYSTALSVYELSAHAKIEGVIEFLNEMEAYDKKVVVFAYHRVMIEALEKFAQQKKKDYIRIDGRVESMSRGRLVDKFQNHPDCKYAFLSITAASTGFTLTASSIVVFAELNWTPANMIQAEDRCHRISQQSTVICYYLIGEGTLDGSIFNMIRTKFDTTSKILDGENAQKLDIIEEGRGQDPIDPFSLLQQEGVVKRTEVTDQDLEMLNELEGELGPLIEKIPVATPHDGILRAPELQDAGADGTNNPTPAWKRVLDAKEGVKHRKALSEAPTNYTYAGETLNELELDQIAEGLPDQFMEQNFPQAKYTTSLAAIQAQYQSRKDASEQSQKSSASLLHNSQGPIRSPFGHPGVLGKVARTSEIEQKEIGVFAKQVQQKHINPATAVQQTIQGSFAHAFKSNNPSNDFEDVAASKLESAINHPPPGGFVGAFKQNSGQMIPFNPNASQQPPQNVPSLFARQAGTRSSLFSAPPPPASTYSPGLYAAIQSGSPAVPNLAPPNPLFPSTPAQNATNPNSGPAWLPPQLGFSSANFGMQQFPGSRSSFPGMPMQPAPQSGLMGGGLFGRQNFLPPHPQVHQPIMNPAMHAPPPGAIPSQYQQIPSQSQPSQAAPFNASDQNPYFEQRGAAKSAPLQFSSRTSQEKETGEPEEPLCEKPEDFFNLHGPPPISEDDITGQDGNPFLTLNPKNGSILDALEPSRSNNGDWSTLDSNNSDEEEKPARKSTSHQGRKGASQNTAAEVSSALGVELSAFSYGGGTRPRSSNLQNSPGNMKKQSGPAPGPQVQPGRGGVPPESFMSSRSGPITQNPYLSHPTRMAVPPPPPIPQMPVAPATSPVTASLNFDISQFGFVGDSVLGYHGDQHKNR